MKLKMHEKLANAAVATVRRVHTTNTLSQEARTTEKRPLVRLRAKRRG